ncbi:MAG: M67 family metallopeptidase [Chitinispirillales bacterium]|jgi:proteasome lid subunit RPN8/RPN11|nr:M67 family metallopeptidase [Chitinispirillales bacterium]
MLVLSPKEDKIIRIAGENAYPNECCGVMIGEVDKAGVKAVKCVQAIDNSWEDGEQYHRFLITPEDILRAEQTARSMKLDVIGFYHSHPDCEAVPSEYDKEHALPFYSYVIVSVKQGKAEDLNSWELTLDRAEFLREEYTV